MLNEMMIVTSVDEVVEQYKAAAEGGQDLFVQYMELFGVKGVCVVIALTVTVPLIYNLYATLTFSSITTY